MISWLSKKEHKADALALGAEEGRDKLRKAAVRSKYPIDPQISGMRELSCSNVQLSTGEYIACEKETRGTETSKYPEEEKEKSIS